MIVRSGDRVFALSGVDLVEMRVWSKRSLVPAVLALVAVVAVLGVAFGHSHGVHKATTRKAATPVRRAPVSRAVHVWAFRYRADNGSEQRAYLALPASYRRERDPPLPLVISPHGRGVTGRANLRLWGDLPALGGFAVVSPDGEGAYSWGAPDQISDLARMPSLVRAALPWVRVDAHRVYAFGGSMGGQETLLLLARHPHLLAGAAAFDSVTNLAYQYREFPLLACDRRCRRMWRDPIGVALQGIARHEIGGTPTSDPSGYARRSPLDYASQIAHSHVPLQLWWSREDLIVRNQNEQSGELFTRIKKINPRAPIEAFVGSWRHTAEMRATSRLPFALAEFGLLPTPFDHRPTRVHYLAPAASWEKLELAPRLPAQSHRGLHLRSEGERGRA